MRKMKTELTPQQEKFAQLVSEGNSYADSYKGAYNAQNMGINTIYVNSSVLMSDNKIAIRVKELQEENKNRNQVTLSEVLEEMAAWLRFNPKTLHNEDGTLKQWSEMTDEEAKCISDYQCEEIWGGRGEDRGQIGVLRKIKLIDKRSTADMFLKKFGAYIENHNHKFDVADLKHISDILESIE